MEPLNHPGTIFDDLTVGAIMAATGADEPNARLILGLHRGIVSGDVEIDGQQFVGTPIREDPDITAATRIFLEMKPGPGYWVTFTATGNRRGQASAAVTVGFASLGPREIIWQQEVAGPPVEPSVQ